MNKFLILSMVLFIGFYSSQSYAEKVIMLNPHEMQLWENTNPWALKATCSIELPNQNSATVRITVLKNKGAINGTYLAKGQGKLLHLKNKNMITIIADAGTAIQLLNLSSKKVLAVCHS